MLLLPLQPVGQQPQPQQQLQLSFAAAASSSVSRYRAPRTTPPCTYSGQYICNPESMNLCPLIIYLCVPHLHIYAISIISLLSKYGTNDLEILDLCMPDLLPGVGTDQHRNSPEDRGGPGLVGGPLPIAHQMAAHFS